MHSLKEHFIAYVINTQLHEVVTPGKKIRILDLGCGTAAYIPKIKRLIPQFEYVGVEPITSSFQVAQKNLAGIEDAKVISQLGYDAVSGEEDSAFDLVFSMSVLEHVKHLDKFLELSAKYVRPGGVMVHRYDLGHALYPSSVKERFHVFLGNTFPALLPERTFVRYVGVAEVVEQYKRLNVEVTAVMNHQMPNAKALEKLLKGVETDMIKELFDWEMKYQSLIQKIPTSSREILFPSISVWGKKS